MIVGERVRVKTCMDRTHHRMARTSQSQHSPSTAPSTVPAQSQHRHRGWIRLETCMDSQSDGVPDPYTYSLSLAHSPTITHSPTIAHLPTITHSLSLTHSLTHNPDAEWRVPSDGVPDPYTYSLSLAHSPTITHSPTIAHLPTITHSLSLTHSLTHNPDAEWRVPSDGVPDPCMSSGSCGGVVRLDLFSAERLSRVLELVGVLC